MDMTDHIVDFEGDTPFYQIKVEVTDDSGETETNSDSIIVLIEVTDVDEPPMFTDADPVPRSVKENQVARYPVGARILAIDPEDKALTYQLGNVPGSTDTASFTIDAQSGQLRTKAPLDYERQEMYEVMVSVTDGVNTEKVEVMIMVDDVNERPMFTESAPVRLVAEDAAPDVLIGAPIVANDPEMDDLIYAIEDIPGRGDASSFALSGGNTDTTGQLILSAVGADGNMGIDYEGMPPRRTYMVRLTVTDSEDEAGDPESPGTIDDTIDVTIMVTHVNEAPMFTRDDSDFLVTTGAYVYAGKVGNRVIDPNGVFRATDPDGSSDTLTYSLTAGNDVFSIDSRTGALTAKVKLTTTPATQTVTVVVRDLAGANDTQAEVTITVQAVTAEKKQKARLRGHGNKRV
jgi:hypothetical protein